VLKREPPKIDPNGINYVDEEELDPAKNSSQNIRSSISKS
jgi:hypothetical protein